MERFSWWRMEQVQHPLSRALCCAFSSILHHVKRFMSHPKVRSRSKFTTRGHACIKSRSVKVEIPQNNLIVSVQAVGRFLTGQTVKLVTFKLSFLYNKQKVVMVESLTQKSCFF